MITKSEYEKKCLEFEEARMYDGRGEYNGFSFFIYFTKFYLFATPNNPLQEIARRF